jgi:flavin-dependent dehydrogenase
MADVAIVGGGPAGLSAALFLEKNGQNTTVFDTDATWCIRHTLIPSNVQ